MAARTWRERLRGLVPPLAFLWAGFWGLVTWNVLSVPGPGAIIGAVFSAIAGLLPAAMLIARKQPRAAAPPPAAELNMPKSVRPHYRRLVAAYEQLESLVADGVIERASLRGVEERIRRLARLLAADASNQELGGQASTELRAQVDELTGLLVRLADVALDRQSAALGDDDRTVAALREALQRMRSEEKAFRELGELEDRL